MAEKIKVAVVGAGISGLYITHLLQKKGYDVTVFEAMPTIGGRLKEGYIRDFKVDLGGQWMHKTTSNGNPLSELIRVSGEEYFLDTKESQIVGMEGGNIYHQPHIIKEFFKYLRNTLLEKDLPLADTINAFSSSSFLKSYMEALLVDLGSCSSDFSTLKFIELLQSDMLYGYMLKNRTMTNFLLSKFSLIQNQKVLLSSPVQEIIYTPGHVDIICNKERFKFHKAIISVPISQLQQDKIIFSPRLPDEKIAAFKKIGMGKGLKIFMLFKESLIGNFSFKHQYAPYYIEQKMGNFYVIITILMGCFADNYYKDKSNYLEGILKELSEISGKNAEAIVEDTLVQDWSSEPYIEGTYSYPLVGIGNARKIAASPIDHTLFFIGEAMNTELAHGYIHGAMDTALKTSEMF